MPIPDIERAVITILAQCRPTHPILAEWVTHLVADVDYATYLHGDFTPSDRAVANAAEEGFVTGREQTLYSPNDWLHRELVDANAHGPRPETIDLTQSYPSERADLLRWEIARKRDDAITRLAGALVRFRHDGRPEGDVTRPLREVEMEITTSLAAAVAEYVSELANELPYRLCQLLREHQDHIVQRRSKGG